MRLFHQYGLQHRLITHMFTRDEIYYLMMDWRTKREITIGRFPDKSGAEHEGEYYLRTGEHMLSNIKLNEHFDQIVDYLNDLKKEAQNGMLLYKKSDDKEKRINQELELRLKGLMK